MSLEPNPPADAGAPLPASWRTAFERLLGQPLPDIRLAVSQGALAGAPLAACQGSAIRLSPRAFGLAPRDGLQVLAHEVAHVAQQLRGELRLERAGAARITLHRRLEEDADAFAARSVRALDASGFDLSRLALPSCAMAGEWLPHVFVRGRGDLPTDVEGWVARFARFGRLEIEIRRVIAYMEARGETYESEQDFVYMVRMVVEILRRPKIGGEIVCVAIPYRDDQQGAAIVADVKLVRQGTGANVVVLVPRGGKNAVPMGVLRGLEDGGIHAIGIRDGASLAALRINGLYVSGGPNDNPRTVGDGRPREARGGRAEVARARHEFEEAMIACAVRENIPLLGICGGSWRVAGVLGGEIRRLGGEDARKHAGPMNEPQSNRHEVRIEPASMLDQILRTDNYRNSWPTHARGEGPELVLPVNSVHWAQSVFPYQGGGVAISARDGGVNEAFEARNAHFQLGIQWHPEYAQNGLDGTPRLTGEMHRRILAAFGDAADDSRAARILQRAIRSRRRAPSSANPSRK
jgi:gamma-glutamyl-gamma-aminobutyrate hydrolase PuuD